MKNKIISFFLVLILLISVFSIGKIRAFAEPKPVTYDFEDGNTYPFSNSSIIPNSTGISALGSFYCDARSGITVPTECDSGIIIADISVVHPVQPGLSITAVNADDGTAVKIMTLTRMSTVSPKNGDWCKQRLDPDKWYDLKIILNLSKKTLNIRFRESGESEYENLYMPHYNSNGNVEYVETYLYDGAVKSGSIYNQNNGYMFDKISAVNFICQSSVSNLVDNIKVTSYTPLYQAVNSAPDKNSLADIFAKYKDADMISDSLYGDLINDNILEDILAKNFKSDAHIFEYLALNFLDDSSINTDVAYNKGYLTFSLSVYGATFDYSSIYAVLYHGNSVEDIIKYKIDSSESSKTLNWYFESGENDNYYVKIMTISDYSLRPLIKSKTYYDNSSVTLIDFSDKKNCDDKKIEYSSIGDVSCAHMKGGDGVKDFTVSTPTGVDWRLYSELNIEMYSVKATGDKIYWVAMSDNSETDGADYYSANHTVDFEGEWKTLKFKYNPGYPSKSEDFNQSRLPLGFGNISGLNMWARYGNAVVSDDTEIYIKRIYLTKGQNSMNIDNPPIAENIPEADMSKIKYNIAQLVKENNPDNAHPRLITTKKKLEQNLSLYNRNKSDYLSNSALSILSSADAALKKGDSVYGTPDGKRLVSTEREMIRTLSMAYLLTGDVKYKNRCFHAIEVMASWKDWNPSHYLCTAEAAFSFALAYDLLYDDWNEYEKSVIRNAIAIHAIEPSLNLWRNNKGISTSTNNWQLVCGGGIGAAALAICDEPGYADVCSELVSEIIATLPRGLNEYFPEGAFPEGPGYWSYATRYFSYIDAALTYGCGTDFGIKDMDGLSNTGYFPIYSNGPTGCFNYSDCGASAVVDPCMFWLGNIYSVPQFGKYAASKSNGGGLFGFLLYDYESANSDCDLSDFELDYKFDGDEPVVYMRSSWENDAMWIGAKGGDNLSSHGHLDIGQYVLDSQGVRWICDIGGYYYEAKDENGKEELWIYTANKRFKYYRNRAESHNVPVLNPDSDADQVISAKSVFTDFSSGENGASAIVDMTEAYAKNAQSAKRGFALTNNRSTVIVRDEIKTSDNVEFYSFITTKQQIVIDESNPKIAYICSGDKRIRLDVVSDFNVSWQTMNAVSLPTSPVPYDNNAYPGYTNEAYRKLYLYSASVKNPSVSIVIRNCSNNENLGSYDNILNLDNWSKYAK